MKLVYRRIRMEGSSSAISSIALMRHARLGS